MYMCNLGEEMSNEAITLCLSEPSLLIIFPFAFTTETTRVSIVEVFVLSIFTHMYPQNNLEVCREPDDVCVCVLAVLLF